MKRLAALFLIAVFALPLFAMEKKPLPLATVFKQTKSPLISFRIQLLVGSIDDPKGKEGVAALTAAMIAGGGTKKHTYDEIVEAFYPMATGFGAQTDKEMTTFTGTTHVDNFDKY